MRYIINNFVFSAFSIFVSGCTSTQISNTSTAPVATKPVTYLTADQIGTTIIGNTIGGTAYFKQYGNIPFQMHFEQATGIYRDRTVVRNNVTTAFGTYRVLDEGQLCRTSKSRRKGRETCFRFSFQNEKYIMENANVDEGTTVISISPGKVF